MPVFLNRRSAQLPGGGEARIRPALWLVLLCLVAFGLGREPEALAQRRGGRGARPSRPFTPNNLGVAPRQVPRASPPEDSSSPPGKRQRPGAGGSAGAGADSESSVGEGPQSLPEGARSRSYELTLPIPQEARDGDLPQLSWRLPTQWPQYFQGLDHGFQVTYRNSAGDLREVPATLCPSAPFGRYRETACRWKITSQTDSLIVIEATIPPGSDRVNSLRIQLDDQHRNLQLAVAAWEARPQPLPPAGQVEAPATAPENAPTAPPPANAADSFSWTPICDSGWLLDRTLPGHRLTRNRVPLSPCEPSRIKIELSGAGIADLKIASLRLAWDPQQTPPGTVEVAQLVRREDRPEAGETDWIFELTESDRAVTAAELEIDWGGPDYRPVQLTIGDSLEPGTPFRRIAEGALLRLPVGERQVTVQQVSFAPRLGKYLKWTVTNRHSTGEMNVTGCRVTRADAWLQVDRTQLPNPPPDALTLTLHTGRTAIESRWGETPPVPPCEPVANIPRLAPSTQFTPITPDNSPTRVRREPGASSISFGLREILIGLCALALGGMLIKWMVELSRPPTVSPPPPQRPAG